MKTDCQGLFGWMFGHKMVARYHTSLPEKIRELITHPSLVIEVIRAAQEKRYVCEVCTRCGRTIDLR